MLTCFERETILIGQTLLFESEAAKWLLPNLTADKFIFSKAGALGSKDHAQIWAAIELLYAQKKSPNVTNVLSTINEKYGWSHAELTSYIDRTKGYYRIHTLDPKALMELAEQVDKAGVFYKTVAFGSPFTKLLENPQDFQSYLDNQIEDVDTWLNEFTSQFRSSVRNGPEGYQHASLIVTEAKQQWEDIRNGVVSPLLPCGLPSLIKHGFFQPGTLVTVHGMSGSGKSALVEQICLGIAIGLQKNNLPGCVAINSMEMTQISLIERAASMLSGFNTNKFLQGPTALQGHDYQMFLQAADYVAQLPLYIDTTNLIKTSVMEYRVNGLHSSDRGPLVCLATDYLELFGDSEESNKEQNLTKAIRNQLGIARTTGAVVLAISQSTYGDGDNRARIAGAGGLRYSQGIRHASDDVIEIWNPIEMKKAGTDFRVPEDLDDAHFWVLNEKKRKGGVSEPIPFFWEGEYTRVIDPVLSYGKSNPELFDHFLKKKEQPVKYAIPEVTEYDWSAGLGGGAF